MLGTAHLNELFAVGVGPHAQGAEGNVILPHVYAQRNGAAQLDGTEWRPVLTL